MMSRTSSSEPVKCLNGGTWNGKACECPPGFGGDKCQSGKVICQNGGSWDGNKCLCTSLYEGPRCEDVVSSIEIEAPPETVSAQMQLSVTVTSEEFTKELLNRSSSQFKNFETSFKTQMDIVYAGIPEYAGINITELTSGSVVVKHDVLLKAKFTPEYKEVFKNVTKKMEQKIMNVTQQQVMKDEKCTSLLCFNSTATKVQNVSIIYNPEEECRKKAGKDFADYFFVEYKDQMPKCINRCTPGYSTSMNCHFGKCMLERSGPRCYCLNTDTHWYRGETCEFSTRKSMVYGLLGTAGAVMLIALVVVLVFALRSRREVKRQKSKVTELYKWHGEDGEQAPGTFQNIGFDTSEEQENSIDLDSIYSNFQPTLGHIDSNTKIKIQRPQVMITSL
ncbi:mucin-17 [Pteronotus mesoamericanus]|uniref:mucin-17 n=1 Tax=Pteronotus mesoamericanus TaxID=1884717 RepID=UPI0023ECFD6E|nr:mucin-17 [Pteronotus parnellii mesoamericanus]